LIGGPTASLFAEKGDSKTTGMRFFLKATILSNGNATYKNYPSYGVTREKHLSTAIIGKGYNPGN
jgi:hypothetical protein